MIEFGTLDQRHQKVKSVIYIHSTVDCLWLRTATTYNISSY
jgi:hypothetical protein